jgi:acyl-CoA thioesterase-1
MKVWCSILVVAVCALTACGGSDPRSAGSPRVPPAAAESSPPAADASRSASAPLADTPVSAERRIVFLGDSLTAGLGLPREQAIPTLVGQELHSRGYRYEVVNAGVSGDTSAGGLRRLDWSLDGDVALLVVELGANDGLRGLPVAEMKQNLDTILTRAHERKIPVLLTGMEAPPNYGPAYTNEFRKVFSDLARAHKVPFVPFFLDGVAGNPGLNQADGIHPNAEGARIVARSLSEAIAPLLVKQDS